MRERIAAARQWLREAFDRPLTAYYILVGATLLLVVLGMLEVFSTSVAANAAAGKPPYSTFQRQLISALLGLPLLWIASKLPPRAYRALAYPLMFGSIMLLGMVVVFGRVSSGGNKNWLVFGPLVIQPSEFAKLALVLWGADLIVRKEKLLTSWDHLLVPLLPGTALIVGLVMLGGDMGTSMIILAIAFSLLWVAGAPFKLFATILGSTALLAAAAVALRPSRARRFTGFLDPASDASGTGYQAIHGFSALAGGGWFGLGLGASKQKLGPAFGGLPEAQTDFIFAIVGEELGLIGSLTVLALFVALGYAGIRIALRSGDAFVRLSAAAITSWLMVQTMINLGAVLGVLPVAGVPLPFVSYGGSSLLPAMFAIGMLSSFARHDPVVRADRTAERPSKLPRSRGFIPVLEPAAEPAAELDDVHSTRVMRQDPPLVRMRQGTRRSPGSPAAQAPRGRTARRR